MGGKKFAIVLFLLAFFLCFIKIPSKAHSTNLGIDGAYGLTYDECVDYVEGMLVDAFYEENWYALVGYRNNGYEMHHIDDDIKTIYYQILDSGYYDSSVTWGSKEEEYKLYTKMGIEKWNLITLFKEAEDGTYYKVPLVNLVDIDSLEDSTGIIPNIIIAPASAESADVSGGTSPIESSIVQSDSQTYNNVLHNHYSQYLIELYPDNLANVSIELAYVAYTACHEVGHVLGLRDIDVVEFCGHPDEWHHQNLLMGYGDVNMRYYDITYNDMAGVLITRGHHTNEDHEWLYDPSVGTDDGHKLICSFCNVVKYVDNLSGYEYEIYQSCCTGFTTSEEYRAAHTMDSPYMIPIASYSTMDYYKCSRCKYIQCFYDCPSQKYMYQGSYTEEYHLMHNNVIGLEYDVRVPHEFSVDLGNGDFKCKDCPYTDKGNVYVDCPDVDLSCVMDSFSNTITLGKNEKYIYRLNVNCNGMYLLNVLANSEIELELFDENMFKLDLLATYSSDNLSASFNRVFIKNEDYYVRVGFNNPEVSGDVTFNASSTSNPTGHFESISMNEYVSVFEHNHDNISNFSFNNNYPRFVNILLSSEANNFNALANVISVMNAEGDIINKYSLSVYNNDATNLNGQNSIVVYLPSLSEYKITINTASLPTDTVISITNLDGYSLNGFVSTTASVVDDVLAVRDDFKIVSLNQNMKLRFDIAYTGATTDLTNGMVVLLEASLDSDGNRIFEVIRYDFVNSNQAYLDYEISLDEGYYYYGYFGSDMTGVINIDIIRCVPSDEFLLITDPDSATGAGTEVTLNGGSYRGTTITSGFTRLVFVEKAAYSQSRLDYNWYSSNPDALSVSAYGTLLAYPVTEETTVTVMAVHKTNYQYVYKIVITIIPDEIAPKVIKTFYKTMNTNSTSSIQLDSTCISTSASQYDWVPFNETYATVSIWGTITTYANCGSIRITGTYKYNPRYIIYVELTIE